METGVMELKKAFTWEVENLASENEVLKSDPFSSGGCEWYLMVYPKGKYGCDHLSVYVMVSNTESLRLGWKRRVSSYFVLLNQSGKEITRTSESSYLYCHEVQGWGYARLLTCSKIQEEGFLEKNKLTIEVYIKVVEVVHQGKSTENDMVEFCGFEMIASQAITIGKIVALHPDFAKDIRPKNKEVKTAYINLLFGLVNTLENPSKSLSKSELSKAESELTELMEVGFKLDWLKSKLEEVSLESDGVWICIEYSMRGPESFVGRVNGSTCLVLGIFVIFIGEIVTYHHELVGFGLYWVSFMGFIMGLFGI